MIFNTYVIFDHQLFAVLWRSLKAYISAINLQHWLMTSGGQLRSTIYFSFWTSSKFGKDGERETILSIKRLRCLSYTGHFKTKCKTDSGSLEHSGQAGAIVLLIRHVDKTFMSILNRVKIFLIQGFLISQIAISMLIRVTDSESPLAIPDLQPRRQSRLMAAYGLHTLLIHLKLRIILQIVLCCYLIFCDCSNY